MRTRGQGFSGRHRRFAARRRSVRSPTRKVATVLRGLRLILLVSRSSNCLDSLRGKRVAHSLSGLEDSGQLYGAFQGEILQLVLKNLFAQLCIIATRKEEIAQHEVAVSRFREWIRDLFVISGALEEFLQLLKEHFRALGVTLASR